MKKRKTATKVTRKLTERERRAGVLGMLPPRSLLGSRLRGLLGECEIELMLDNAIGISRLIIAGNSLALGDMAGNAHDAPEAPTRKPVRERFCFVMEKR